MADLSQNSVTHWLQSLRRGGDDAARNLWDRYFSQLVALARNQLGLFPRRIADEEDVALSVFDALVRGATAGRFPDLQDRRDLWSLIIAITKRKVVDLKRREGRQKRGGGTVRVEPASNKGPEDTLAITLDDLCGDEPTPEFFAILNEEHRHLLGLLRDDVLRKIANQTLEGYSTDEIADGLEVSARTVQRKLTLIRETWSHALFLQ